MRRLVVASLLAAAAVLVAAPARAQSAPADSASSRDSTARASQSTEGRAPVGFGAPCVVVGPDGSCDPRWRPGECRRGAKESCPDGTSVNRPCVDQDMDQRCDAQPTVVRKRGFLRGVANFFTGWFVSSLDERQKERDGGDQSR